ncbi:MAG: hypothetical protein LC808_36730, partial [Actinobacteria bacterium]|nr:hypothetical protein [Actinomycetota bacterium]
MPKYSVTVHGADREAMAELGRAHHVYVYRQTLTDEDTGYRVSTLADEQPITRLRRGMATDPSTRLWSLIPTKLYAPVTRPLMPRKELFGVLRARPGVKLTLVCAPAGWGKSSLLAAWAAVDERRRPFAWFAIDEADNDAVRFWTYLIEALRTVQPAIGARSLTLLRAPGTGLTDLVVPELINEVAALDSPMVLVLDDYHLIEEPEIHRSLASLVENLPDVLHVAIATRREPCLPIARLRARGELTEVDAAALGFSVEEAGRFFNEFLGLALLPADIRILRERTEGWAAGLYLAALS